MGGERRSADLAGIDEALLRLRRILVHAMRAHAPAGQIGDIPVEFSHVLVVDAAGRVGADGGEVTVRRIAEHLGVERSTASRLVDSAARAGWVTTGPSTVDARRTVVTRTELGAALDERAHSFRRAYLERLLSGWPAADVADLARLMGAFAALTDAHPPGGDGAPRRRATPGSRSGGGGPLQNLHPGNR